MEQEQKIQFLRELLASGNLSESEAQEIRAALPPEPQKPKEEELGFFEGIAESFTGERRSTPEIEALPDIGNIPELSEFSLRGLKTALGRVGASIPEMVSVFKEQFPGIQVRQDQKGNYILKSSLDQKEYAIKPGFQVSDIPRAITGMLAFTPAGRGAGVLSQMGRAAATETGIQGIQSAVGGEFNPEDIAMSTVMQGVGAGVERMAGGASQSAKNLAETAETAQELGIDVLTSDIAPPQTIVGKRAQQLTEQIPFVGPAAAREAQQQSRKKAVRQVLEEFDAIDAADLPAKIYDDLESQVKGATKKYQQAKAEIIERLDDTEKFVEPKKTQEAIANAYVRLSDTEMENIKPFLNSLDKFDRALDKKTLAQFDLQRNLWGDFLKDDSFKSIRSEAQKEVRKIYGSMLEDMGNYIKENGQRRDFTKWQVTRKRLADGISESKNTILGKTLDKGDFTPEVVSKMLLSKKPTEIKQLYRKLTPDGRANGRAAILSKAADKAKSELSDGTVVFSPEKFSSELDRLSDSVNVFFKGADKEKLKGLQKALNLTKRASQSNVLTLTGMQNQPLIGAGLLVDIFGTGGSATVAAGLMGGAASAYESKPVRNLLIQLAKLPTGSKKAQEVINKLTTALQSARQGQQGEN